MSFLLEKYYQKEIIFLWLIAFFAISPNLFYAQPYQYSFHQLTTEEGLSQSSNDYIYHDSKGFVWLSSIDGLNRFDGKNVKIYKSISGDTTSLLGNIITSNFFEDEDSNLWFTTYEGIHCYIRKQDNFRHFQIKNKDGIKFKQDYYAFHLDKKNQLYVKIGTGNSAQLFLFDHNKYTTQYCCVIYGQRNSPYFDKNGNIQSIFSFRYNRKHGIKMTSINTPFNSQTFFDGKDKNFPKAYVYHVNIDNPKTCFLSSKIGLIKFDLDNKQYLIFDKYKNSSIGTVRSTVSVNDSTLWVSSSTLGILIFNKKTNQFLNHIPYEPQKKFGLQKKEIRQFYKDSKENIWISSSISGVNYTNLKKTKFLSPPEFSNNIIRAIYENKKGELFCSHQKGSVSYYTSAKAEVQNISFRYPPQISKQNIQFFIEDKDDQLWGFSGDQLLKWDSKKTQFVYWQNLPSYILYVFKNQNDQIILATYSGIFEWKDIDGKISFQPYEKLNGFQKELATAIYEDKNGKLYLALDASRLLVLKLDQGKYVEANQIEGIGYAKSFYEQNDTLWVATSTGILKINTKDLSSRMLNEIYDGAPNENYYSILPDDNNSFWLSSNQGIIRYFPKEKLHRRYTLVDGLQANEYNTNAFLKTSQGEIWMGGTKGLNRFFPNKIKDIPHLSKTQITRLLVNDKPYSEIDQQIGELENLSLKHFENTISFDFVALEYSDPENNQLKYKLENHDEDWVDAEKNGFARYPSLPFGNYIFKLKAANSDGVWNEEIKTLNIFIATPWWRTWWFYTFCILAISGIIYGVSMYRLQQALKIERLRVKISSDLHDDVGGLLAGLMMQSELLEITGTEERKPKLQRISDLSRKAMSRMRDTVWAIDSRKDKFKNLLDRIREHAAETLELKNIEWDLQVDNIPLEKNINSQLRQNIYLICKEAITNVAKHSNGDQLNIKFEKYGRKGIYLSIHDNGKVPEKNLNSSGLGMSNLQMRADQIGAKLNINKENGFLITLILD
ncbi:MAG: triple tyrosine motif-containing protein [Saprospiraceae bacterium]